MAIALPLTARLVQTNTENRSKAAGVSGGSDGQCSSLGGRCQFKSAYDDEHSGLPGQCIIDGVIGAYNDGEGLCGKFSDRVPANGEIVNFYSCCVPIDNKPIPPANNDKCIAQGGQCQLWNLTSLDRSCNWIENDGSVGADGYQTEIGHPGEFVPLVEDPVKGRLCGAKSGREVPPTKLPIQPQDVYGCCVKMNVDTRYYCSKGDVGKQQCTSIVVPEKYNSKNVQRTTSSGEMYTNNGGFDYVDALPDNALGKTWGPSTTNRSSCEKNCLNANDVCFPVCDPNYINPKTGLVDFGVVGGGVLVITDQSKTPEGKQAICDQCK